METAVAHQSSAHDRSWLVLFIISPLYMWLQLSPIPGILSRYSAHNMTANIVYQFSGWFHQLAHLSIYRTMSSFDPLSFTLAYHTLHTHGLSLSKSLCSYCLFITWKYWICLMGRIICLATYTHYFAPRMQLTPAPQSLFSFHLGCSYRLLIKSENKLMVIETGLIKLVVQLG